MGLLQIIAERVICGYLVSTGAKDVKIVSGFEALGGHGVDVVFTRDGVQRQAKVKPDPYFGTDSSKVSDRARVFYRANAESYAFEAVANAAMRTPGWIFSSPADDIYYYRVALTQQEDEIIALSGEPDEVFFSELAIERDELQIIPMKAARRMASRRPRMASRSATQPPQKTPAVPRTNIRAPMVRPASGAVQPCERIMKLGDQN